MGTWLSVLAECLISPFPVFEIFFRIVSFSKDTKYYFYSDRKQTDFLAMFSKKNVLNFDSGNSTNKVPQIFWTLGISLLRRFAWKFLDDLHRFGDFQSRRRWGILSSCRQCANIRSSSFACYLVCMRVSSNSLLEGLLSKLWISAQTVFFVSRHDKLSFFWSLQRLDL